MYLETSATVLKLYVYYTITKNINIIPRVDIVRPQEKFLLAMCVVSRPILSEVLREIRNPIPRFRAGKDPYKFVAEPFSVILP